jgi:hypothetical protein
VVEKPLVTKSLTAAVVQAKESLMCSERVGMYCMSGICSSAHTTSCSCCSDTTTTVTTTVFCKFEC